MYVATEAIVNKRESMKKQWNLSLTLSKATFITTFVWVVNADLMKLLSRSTISELRVYLRLEGAVYYSDTFRCDYKGIE